MMTPEEEKMAKVVGEELAARLEKYARSIREGTLLWADTVLKPEYEERWSRTSPGPTMVHRGYHEHVVLSCAEGTLTLDVTLRKR